MATLETLRARALETAKLYAQALNNEDKALVALNRAKRELEAAREATQAALTKAADANLELEDYLHAQKVK